MEYAVVIFVGLWVVAAGVLAYYRINKDFADMNTEEEAKNKEGEE